MTNSKDTKDELISLREACELLKCHPNTLRAWDNKGLLKAVRFGVRGDRKYKKKDILNFLTKDHNDKI
jgi:excisionase family DNA binding protein